MFDTKDHNHKIPPKPSVALKLLSHDIDLPWLRFMHIHVRVPGFSNIVLTRYHRLIQAMSYVAKILLFKNVSNSWNMF